MLGVGGAGAALGVNRWFGADASIDRTRPLPDGCQDRRPRFLIVIGGFGGASIIDSFLAIRNSESRNWRTINSFIDSEVVDIPGSPIRAVDLARDAIGGLPVSFTARQSAFVTKHKRDMLVVTHTGTSVNHAIGQKRSIDGNGAWRGRTLQEVVASEYGSGHPAPNVNMARLGFRDSGGDASVPANGCAEPVEGSLPWPMGDHDDPMDAQAALALWLLENRMSVTVTLSPSFDAVRSPSGGFTNLPLAFDYSHNDHRAAQAFMWQRTLDLADRLIDLLAARTFDAETGESFWDRSLIYIATEFGRSKNRTAGREVFGTGHHPNNGSLIVSPLVKGNTVLGGVDPETGLTYGFDPRTGVGDPHITMTERHIYAGILQALDVDTTGSGLPDMPAMRRHG